MVGLFNRRRRADSYQGFSKYTHDINTFHHPTQHAGLPLQSSSQQQQERSQSMTTAGAAAAAAALRLHSTPVKQQQQPPQRQYGRSNSLSAANRSNSLRQYTYHPKSSYQTGAVGASSSSSTDHGAKRYGSLTSQSRNSLTRTSQGNQRQLRQSQSHRDNLHEVEEENQHRVHHINEDQEEVDYIVTTTTTKVVDSQGRTQSITTKTVKTFPDGSNIIETATKNISRSNSRTNSLSSNNYRQNSMTASLSHQPVNLTKIDEDLQNFDYDYQVDTLDSDGKLKLNTGEQHHHHPLQDRDVITEEAEDEQQLGAPFGAGEVTRPEKPRQYSVDRTSSLNSQNKPLRSILKGQNPMNPPQTDLSPVGATSEVAREDIESPLADNHHPYKHLTSGVPEHQHYRQSAKPHGATSPQSNNSNGFNRQSRQQFSSPREHVHYSRSPGSSIKFDDKVETIPVQRSNYPQPNSPKQYQSRTKQAPTGPPPASSMQQPSADFYAAAMQAAYKKVYGDRDQAAASNPNAVGVTSTSPEFQPTSPPQPPQQQIERKPSTRKSKFGFIPLTPRKEAPTSPQLDPPVQPAVERTSSLNSLIKNKISRDEKAQAAMSKGSVPVNYEYVNHHKQFPMHSMREDPQKFKEQNKEQKQAAKEQAKLDKARAKEQVDEEKRLAKEQADQEKRLAKEQADQEKVAAKEAKKREKKPFLGFLSKKNRRLSQAGSVYSGTSSNVGASSPQQAHHHHAQRDSISSGVPVIAETGAAVVAGTTAGVATVGKERDVNGAPQTHVGNTTVLQSPVPVTPVQHTRVEDDAIAGDAIATVPYGKDGTVPTDFTVTEKATSGIAQQPGEDRAPIHISSPVNVKRLGPNIESEADELQYELGHNNSGRYGVNGEGVVGSEPTLEKETASPVQISAPIKVERIGPNIEAEADNLTNELDHEHGAGVGEEDISRPTLDPRVKGIETGGDNVTEAQEHIYSKEDAAAAPVVVPATDVPKSNRDVDEGQSCKISVSRKYSNQEDNDVEPGDQIQLDDAVIPPVAGANVLRESYYPSPNLSNKQRNSTFEHAEPKEGETFSKVPVPELNDIDDDEDDSRVAGDDTAVVDESREVVPVAEDPSFNSYEKIPTPKIDDEKYQVVDRDEVSGAKSGDKAEGEIKSVTESEPVVIEQVAEPVASPSENRDAGYKTPQVDAEPAFVGKKERPSSEVGASAFVVSEKLADPRDHRNLVSENFAGSQFVKRPNSRSGSPARGLQGQPKSRYVSDENPQPTVESHQQPVSDNLQVNQGQDRYKQVQQVQPLLQDVANEYSSSAEPSGETLPTTQSKHNDEAGQHYNQENLEGVLVEEKHTKGKMSKKEKKEQKKREKKEKKEKKSGGFKEKMLSFFVTGYDE